MKKGFTKIAVVLDRSGSMLDVRDVTISSFNEFINAQKLLPGEASVKLVQFDDMYEPKFDLPLAEVPALTTETFVPRGGTALHDAIVKTVNDLGSELAKLKESSRPDKVIVVIVTDGQENASRLYDRAKVAEVVAHQKNNYAWDFVFLGANQDAVLTARGFSIPAHSALSYTANLRGVTGSNVAMTNYVSDVRLGKSAAFSSTDRANSVSK